MSDVATLEAFFTEVLPVPEEAGLPSMAGLTVKTADLALHSISVKSGGAWGKPREMAEAFWQVATRYAAGVASPGGAIQFVISVCYAADPRPRKFQPFFVMAAPQIAPGMMTENSSPQGALAQGMRLSELLVQGSFKQNGDNAQFAATIIDRCMRRQAELENDNRELFTALKLVIVEFQKSAHEMRMREIAAMRAAAFQKKMQDLLPILVNMAAEGTLPEAAEEQSIADALASTYTRPQAETMLAGIAATPNGQLLAGALKKKLDRAYARQEADREADEKLLRDVPLGSFAKAAEDAAGRAVNVIRDQAAPKQLNGNGHSNGKNDHAPVVVEQPRGDAEKLRSLLFAAVPDAEELEGLTAMLRMKGATELAEELERQFREHAGERP